MGVIGWIAGAGFIQGMGAQSRPAPACLKEVG
jgi:hypothetical protein